MTTSARTCRARVQPRFRTRQAAARKSEPSPALTSPPGSALAIGRAVMPRRAAGYSVDDLSGLDHPDGCERDR
jgi:hypothetical protein